MIVFSMQVEIMLIVFVSLFGVPV